MNAESRCHSCFCARVFGLLRPRFGLRTAFLLIAVIAALCGWLIVEKRQYDRQERAVRILRLAGATVYYDHEIAPDYVFRVNNGTPAGPQWLRNLLGETFFSKTPYVSLSTPHLIDKHVARLADLPSIDQLYLENGSITDGSLRHLLALKQLSELILRDTQVTDKGMEIVARLPRLTGLALSRTGITGDGLAVLTGTQLESLDLEGCRIGDDDLKHLAAMKSLRVLSLGETDVTPDGVQWLRAQLSECEIRYEAPLPIRGRAAVR